MEVNKLNQSLIIFTNTGDAKDCFIVINAILCYNPNICTGGPKDP